MVAVRQTPDFDRIVALPRRVLSRDDAEAWADALTLELRDLGSTAVLRPWQAIALAEAHACHGAYLALPVGAGKTLIAELLPVVLGALRPVLILPGGDGMRAKTFADRAALLRDGWRLATPPARIVSMTELALETNARLLNTLRPDLIVIDESDELANRASAACRRIDRYVVAQQDRVAVVCMTGTPSRNSILGYWHHVMWALRDRAPMPMHEGEAVIWAAAIDNARGRGRRPSPGPLGRTVTQAREWFRARFTETPGVVVVDEDSAGDVPLTIRTRVARTCLTIDAHFESFLLDMESPGGEPVTDPLSRWRIDAQLGCGFYQRWNPAPPEPWRLARRAVARFIRDRIEASTHTPHPLDTEAQVLRRYSAHPVVRAWADVRDTFVPRTEAVWFSPATVESAAEWLTEDAAPGIVWCGSVEFAEALATATGLPYYSRRGRDARGRELHAAPVENMIVSWQANKKGFNLQPWRRALIVTPPQSAKWIEQVIGRSHRSRQTHAVTIDVLLTSGGTYDAFETAITEAHFARATVSLTQKITRATIERASIDSDALRWARKGQQS